jgi:single-strand DNA-binding protein
MINLHVIGNIGRDASINETNGRKAINFAVAHNNDYKDSQGNEIKNTIWVNCTMWRKPGDSLKIKDYLTAGTQVFVEGEPSVRTYKNKDGIHVATLDCNVRKVELLGGSKKQDGGNVDPVHQESGTSSGSHSGTSDDLPY